VERLYFGRNVTTAEMVFQARGVTLLFAARLGIPVFEPKPAEVKQTVCGYGSADKAQVRGMVRLILGLDELPSPDDAADALAIAVVGLALASAPGAAFSPEVCR
jgi:crossover junction endodeoxyribonuclease RuvC